MNTNELNKFVVHQLEEMKADDIVVIDVSNKTTVADFFTFACGTSRRHTQAIATRIVDRVKEQGIKPLGVEGYEIGDWILIDLNDVVLHIMLEETRKFYDLESLWQDQADWTIREVVKY